DPADPEDASGPQGSEQDPALAVLGRDATLAGRVVDALAAFMGKGEADKYPGKTLVTNAVLAMDPRARVKDTDDVYT
ncbi:unnamed protein product, partial [Amoebophrya sp. A25]